MKQLLIGGGILVLVVSGWWFIQHNQSSETVVIDQAPAQETDLDTRREAANSLLTNETGSRNASMRDDETTVTTTPTRSDAYQTYSPAALAASTAAHNVLIFSATWCPTCRALDTDITTNVNNIPGDVALFTIDYDTNLALRQQYGITTQHTLVAVTTDGTMIKSWRGGTTLAALLTNI